MRKLIVAILLVAGFACATECAPGTLADYVALGSTGCTLTSHGSAVKVSDIHVTQTSTGVSDVPLASVPINVDHQTAPENAAMFGLNGFQQTVWTDGGPMSVG